MSGIGEPRSGVSGRRSGVGGSGSAVFGPGSRVGGARSGVGGSCQGELCTGNGERLAQARGVLALAFFIASRRLLSLQLQPWLPFVHATRARGGRYVGVMMEPCHVG